MSSSQQDDFSSQFALAALRRRRLLILATGAIAAVAAFAVSFAAGEKYRAQATVLVEVVPGIADFIFGQGGTRDPARELATAEEQLKAMGSSVVAPIPSGSVFVEVQEGSDVIKVTGESPESESAVEIANDTAEKFVSKRRREARAEATAAREQVEKGLEDLSPDQLNSQLGRNTSEQLLQLEGLEATANGNVAVDELATPPPAPDRGIIRNTVFGGIVGLFLGAAFAILAALFNRRLETPAEIERAFEMPLLAEIPDDDRLAASRVTVGEEGALEPLRMLRAGLGRLSPGGGGGSLLLTSAGAGEGKTTIAWSLATAAAIGGTRTVLVECNMRRPTIAHRHGLLPGPGLADLLAGQANRDAVTQSVAGGGEQRAFDVIVAGATPADPGAALEQSDMRSLLEDLADDHELVIVDAPPLGFVADAIPLLALVDSVLVVARCGEVTEQGAERLRRQLAGFPGTPGLVANFSSRVPDAGRYRPSGRDSAASAGEAGEAPQPT